MKKVAVAALALAAPASGAFSSAPLLARPVAVPRAPAVTANVVDASSKAGVAKLATAGKAAGGAKGLAAGKGVAMAAGTAQSTWIMIALAALGAAFATSSSSRRDGFDGRGGYGNNGISSLPSALYFVIPLIVASPYVPGAAQLNEVVGWFLLACGGLLIRGGVLSLENVRSRAQAPSGPWNELKTDGAFSLCRHPLYGGLVTACLGLSMVQSSTEQLVGSVVLYALLSYMANEEEKRLEDEYGSAFTSWAKSVPRLLPDINKPQKVYEALTLGAAEVMGGDRPRQMIEDEVMFEARSAPLVVFTWREKRDKCKKALDMLRDVGVNPKVVQLDELGRVEGNLRRSALGRITGTLIAPSVWIGGRYIGGFDSGPGREAPGLVKLSFDNELDYRLEDVGILTDYVRDRREARSRRFDGPRDRFDGRGGDRFGDRGGDDRFDDRGDDDRFDRGDRGGRGGSLPMGTGRPMGPMMDREGYQQGSQGRYQPGPKIGRAHV